MKTAPSLKTATEAFADERKKRDRLKTKRNLLYGQYLKNPKDTQLALEIKKIDDEVAECTKQMDRARGVRN